MPSRSSARLASATRSSSVVPWTSAWWSAATSLGDAGEHLVEHLALGVATGLVGVHLLEVTEKARQQLQVGAADVFAAFGGEEDQRGPSDAVTLQSHVQQAIGAQAVEVPAHRLLAQIQGLRELCDRYFAPSAYESQDLFARRFHNRSLAPVPE